MCCNELINKIYGWIYCYCYGEKYIDDCEEYTNYEKKKERSN